MDNKYLTSKAAAEYLGLKVNYLYKLTSKKLIPFYSPTGRHIIFAKEDLDEWVRAAKVPSQSELEANAQTTLAKKGGKR